MKFLSTRTLVASVGIGLLVGLFGLTGAGKILLKHFQNGYEQYNSGNDVTTYSSRLVVEVNYTQMPPRTYSYGYMKLQDIIPRDKKLFVDKSGSGDTTTVQEAVDAVRNHNKERVTIHIKAGTYVEKVHVPITKHYITFEGAGMDKSIISWNDDESITGSTEHTATVTVDADYFIARNISFQNTAPRPTRSEKDGGQAVALQVSGDSCAFYGCGMYGYQDTLYDFSGRHLFRECHIEGAVDFIFGNARSLYERCTIKSIANETGSMTAQSRLSKDNLTGFGFVNCSIVGTGLILLGRAWRSYARVVIASTFMENIIDIVGWDDWGNKSADKTVYFGEYGNSGPGANMSGRVDYVRALSPEDAADFTRIDWIDGSEWLQDI